MRRGGARGGRVCGGPTGKTLQSLRRSELWELPAAASFLVDSSFTGHFLKHLSVSELINENYLLQ